jgi:hypothetical protein
MMFKQRDKGMTARSFILGVVLALVALQVAAESAVDSFSKNPNQSLNPNVEEYEWEEGEWNLPQLPSEESLLEFSVDQSKGRFTYFIDKNSLSISEKDGVVRYTLVVRSRTGANNIIYEGMRCPTREYKSYAYGNGRGEWRQARRPSWRPIYESGAGSYRFDLWNHYLCTITESRRLPTVEEIIGLIKYPKSHTKDNLL